MRFSTLIAVFPALAAADFSLWSGSCDTGLGEGGSFSSPGIATDGQGACGGCSAASDWSGGNPCNGDCGADPLEFRSNGNNLDIIVRNTGINVGHCEPTTGPNAACTEATYTCSMVQAYRCITSYCN
ncbi:hypothetical protein LIA77_11831 [Sarocladium implicatum]|nr:hypothetical protein LIA77_11831 [Sarocladium implicatum]